jgi:hypothetical protein
LQVDKNAPFSLDKPAPDHSGSSISSHAGNFACFICHVNDCTSSDGEHRLALRTARWEKESRTVPASPASPATKPAAGTPRS